MPVDKGDPRRWAVLLIFCVYSGSNAIQWITYASIATNVREYFRITTNELNWLSSVYMIVFAAGAYFTCTTFERWGVRLGVLIGCSLNALGSILKLVPGVQVRGYPVLIASQTLNSFAQLFVLSTPPLIAAQYFAPQHRAFATAIASTANNIGNAIALFVPPLIVSQGTAKEFYILFGIEMGLCCAALVATFFFLKPPAFRAPSSALLGVQSTVTDRRLHDREVGADGDADAEGEDEEEIAGSPTVDGKGALSVTTGRAAAAIGLEASAARHPRGRRATDVGSESKRKPLSFCRRLRHNREVVAFLEVGHTVYRLCRNRDFLLLLVAFSISVGSVWTYSSVLAQILEPFGLTATMAGIAGSLNVLAGVVMAYVVGLWVDRKRRYKWIVVVCLCGSVLTCLGLMVIMLKVQPNTSLMTGLSMFVYIFAGVFQGTATPVSFEFAMEITYPLPESVPGAMLMAGANIVSLVLLSISSAILGDGTPDKMACVYVVVLVVAVCAVGALLAFFPRERLHRRDAELHAQEQLAELAMSPRVLPVPVEGSSAAVAVAAVPGRATLVEPTAAPRRKPGREGDEAFSEGEEDPHGVTPELRQEPDF